MTEQWRTEKVRRPRVAVQPVVDQLAAHFTAAGVQFEFGGSWRRGCESIGDVDVIVVTESLEQTLLAPGLQLPSFVRWDRRAAKIAQGSTFLDNGGELHIDVWAVRPEEFGAFMWFVIGPKELNIEMRRTALRKGMNLSQIGLLRDGTQIDDGTERDVALKLGWPWMEPEQRQTYAEDRPTRFEVPVAGSKGAEYKVRLEGGFWTCTCPHFTYRAARCKHIAKVAADHPQQAVPVLASVDPFEGLDF